MNEQEKLESTGRRDLLKSMGLAAAGLALEIFAADLPLAAAIHHHLEQKPAEPAQAGPFRPQFFQGREAETVFRLTDLILPNDGTSGARDARVTEFLDFYLANSPEAAQSRFREGLKWLEGTSQTKFGKPFVDLEESQQTALLTQMASVSPPAESNAGDPTGANFFRSIRGLTVFAFYTSKIGIQELGYVGNTFTTQFPGACTHSHEL